MRDYFTDALMDAVVAVNESVSAISENGTKINPINLNFDDLDSDFIQGLNEFFEKIPKDRWDEEAKFLAEEFFELAYNEDAKLWNDYSKKYRGKKEQDIEALKQAKDVLNRIAPLIEYSYQGDEVISVIDEDISGNVIHKRLDKIIHDLETGEFNVVVKTAYKTIAKRSKKMLESRLYQLAIEYHIEKPTGVIKRIKDRLSIPQVATLCKEADSKTV